MKGLLIAMESMDAVVATVRSAPDAASASAQLVSKFGLSELQAEAVLAMALRRLTSLEADKLHRESEELSSKITDLEGLLASPQRVADTLVEEAAEVAAKFGDDRRTALRLGDDGTVDDDALVPEGESIVVFSKRGFVKRMPADTFAQQHRGTRGKLGSTPRGEGDGVGDFLAASNRDTLLFFTREGGVFSLRVHAIPEASRGAAGTAIPKLIAVDRGDGFAAMLAVQEFSQDQGLLLLTRNGLVKRTALDQFAKVRRSGIVAMGMREGSGDELTWVARAPAGSRVLLAASNGYTLLFATDSLRSTGRSSTGVVAMKLAPGAKLVGMCVLPPPPGYVPKSSTSEESNDNDSSKDEEDEGDDSDVVDDGPRRRGVPAADHDDGSSVLFVTKNGMGKRVPLSAFRVMRRNCTGVRAIKMLDGDELAALLPVPGDGSGGGSGRTERQGRRAANAASSSGSGDLLVGTASGVIVRLAPTDIPTYQGRLARGVRVVKLAEGDTVATVTAMSGEGEDDEGSGNSVASAAGKRSSSSAESASSASSSAPSRFSAATSTGRKTAYMVFCDSRREQVRAELLGAAGDASAAKMTAVAAELGRRWRGMSEAEKAEWKPQQ